MATIGVLCARARVEEKQLMAALAEAGARPTPLPPANVPLPIGPHPATPSPYADTASGGVEARVIVDRCQDRAVAAAVLTACRALGATTLDAGLAATGDRLAIAGALSGAGLPRPETRLACSPEAALAALAEIGYPGTLLPLTAGAAPVVLLDVDTAEAVLEHRSVLGSSREALALVQGGAPSSRATVVVVEGRAVAATAPEDGDRATHASPLPTACQLAEQAAAAVGASVVGIEIALTGAGPVVWDIDPVPEFRHAVPLGDVTVAEAVAACAVARLGIDAGRMTVQGQMPGRAIEVDEPDWRRANPRREVRDGVVLSA